MSILSPSLSLTPSPLSLSAHTVLPWALESWAEYDIKIFAKEGDLEKYANSEHALCVLNHRGDLDWMIGWVLIERIGMLGVSLMIIVIIVILIMLNSNTVIHFLLLSGYQSDHEGCS